MTNPQEIHVGDTVAILSKFIGIPRGRTYKVIGLPSGEDGPDCLNQYYQLTRDDIRSIYIADRFDLRKINKRGAK